MAPRVPGMHNAATSWVGDGGDHRGDNAGTASVVDVSILVTVRDEERVIRQTVAAMRAQRFDGTAEYLFIDGGSKDRTKAILEEIASFDDCVRVLDNSRGDQASGLNVGLRHARGEFLVQMDAHTYYGSDYVFEGVKRLRGPQVDWVSGPVVPHGIDPWSRRVAMALASPLGYGGSAKWAASVKREITLDTGVFGGVWRRSTLERHGGWDEGWPVNHDSELAARVLKSGGRIVCLPELAARYIPRDSLSGLLRQYRRYGYYRAKTARRHAESLRRSAVLPPGLVLTLAVSCLPTRLGRLSRRGVLLYALCLTGAAAREARPGQRLDAALLPAVLATMHIAWGAGFLAGCLRFGRPLSALARLAGLRGQR